MREEGGGGMRRFKQKLEDRVRVDIHDQHIMHVHITTVLALSFYTLLACVLKLLPRPNTSGQDNGGFH